MMHDDIQIRPLTTLAEMVEAEKLQRTVWDIPDLEIVPVHAQQAIQSNGGALIGAFAGTKIVGFVLGVLGASGKPASEHLMMHSVMAGTLPAWQGQGIGYRLKLAQREYALDLGLDVIMWTYDPLRSLNGRFNIHKLGAICYTYRRNHYGELSGIDGGLPTDRFKAIWQLTSDQVRACVAGERRPLTYPNLIAQGTRLTNPATFNSDNLPIPASHIQTPHNQKALVEIPADIQAIKQHDLALAQRWREQTRTLFENLFQSGCTVTDFITHQDENGRHRSFYLLEP